jgi:hypothetical protein
MNVDQLLQELSTQIYEQPLSATRHESDYPNLSNPLHIAVLLIDFDTEININGMLGFLENSNGQHLDKIVEALRLIGAHKSEHELRLVQDCMRSHGVSWERLRADFEGHEAFEVTSFSELHGDLLREFSDEICYRFSEFDLFNTNYSLEDSYSLLVRHLESMPRKLNDEVNSRNA